MSGKVANYSGALQVGDKVHIVCVPGDYPYKKEIERHFGKTCEIVKKVMSAPPYCTIWYYLDFGPGISALPVTRDMIQ